MIFFGEYNLQLDEKNRMRVPAKLRSLIGKNFFVLFGTNKSLFVMDEEKFMAYTESLNKIKLSNKDAQNVVRQIMASVFSPEEDAQGRFVLPQKAKNFAGIKKKIVFIGVSDRMEIWSEENYKKTFENQEIAFDDAFEKLDELGI